MRKLISLVTPIILHQAIALAVAFLFQLCADQYGLPYDATLVVLVGNLIVIPFAAQMYWRDSRERAVSGESLPDWSLLSGRETAPGKELGTGKLAVENARQWQVLLFGAVCFIGGGVLNVVWSGVLNLLQIQARFSNQVQEQLFAADLILQIVGLGVVAPIAEELIFRGLTYRRMRQFFPVWMSAVLSALLFALYHGNMIQMIFAFPLAIVLALVYERGKLFCFPLLFHMGSNLTAILLQILSS